MKLASYFDAFLKDTVNLNQTRIGRLNNHVDAVKDFLRSSGYGASVKRFSAQGSWAHKTIIKPLENKEFDADLVMFVRPAANWSPKDYVADLYRVFRGSGTYREKTGRNTRCITLDYYGDFHLDVVPCIVRENEGRETGYQVCNFRSDDYEVADPEGYTAWLAERNAWTGNNELRKVTRLVKYLRDIKGRFSAKSILLTTLLGNQIIETDQQERDTFFPDVPTGLKTIFGRLDDFLQAYPLMPEIKNPVLPQENFTRHWDQDKYENFRNNINRYRQWIDEAYDEPARQESIRKWRRLFGDDFAPGVVTENKAVGGIEAFDGQTAAVDVVEKVKRIGPGVLNRIPVALPHVQPPGWKMVNKYGVFVSTKLCDQIRGNSLCTIASGEVLKKEQALRFEARMNDGWPFSKDDYRMEWRVVNSGPEAKENGCLRGDFYSSDPPAVRWEETLYRGAHWVEAFLIRKRDNICLGKSERFFVVIE